MKNFMRSKMWNSALKKYASKHWLQILVVLLWTWSCANENTWIDPIVYSDEEPVTMDETPETMLQAIDQISKQYPLYAKDLADIQLILSAEQLESVGRFNEALAQWKKALKIARGRFGQKAFHGWVKAYTRQLGQKVDPLVLAKLILAETKSGESYAYLTEAGLENEAKMATKLKSLIPEALSVIDGDIAIPSFMPQDQGGIGPTQDPLLTKTAMTLCSQKKANLTGKSWIEWVNGLPPPIRHYWEGLIAQCSGQTRAARTALRQSYDALRQKPATHALALEAISRVAAIERSLGLRKDAADTYLEVIKAWSLKGVEPHAMGLSRLQLGLRQVDETLWASRYRALFGDHENAKIFAQDSLDVIQNLHQMDESRTGSVREQLSSLKAEAYHSLAFRIAVQDQEYQSAAAINQMALEVPHLTSEWSERLEWYAGFYEYLAGQYASAKKKWQNLLGRLRDPSQKPMIYFWLARATANLEQAAESEFFLNLIREEFPLSFYAVVAPQTTGFKLSPAAAQSWARKSALVEKIRSRPMLEVQKLRMDPAVGPLIRRAEALTKARMTPLALLALDDLEKHLSHSHPVESNLEPHLYLALMHHNLGQHLKVISQLTQMSKKVSHFWTHWPEQILLYYPQPFKPFFSEAHRDTNVDINILYAVARQESGFTPDIKSHAQAIGIMQLIRPTAERFVAELGRTPLNLDQELREPRTNIQLGARYLRLLSSLYPGFAPGVYGGYNAGELAVNQWIKLRSHPDPLVFVELVPFAETRDYIKGVWRNVSIYNELNDPNNSLAFRPGP